MFRTVILCSSKRSLALSVHFKHPDFGMEGHEILCRASAFLLNVDPPRPSDPEGRYAQLELARKQRADRLKKEDYAHDPASGPPRNVQDLGWLEFAPGAFRPLVHCLASSHVLAPWKWKQYYPADWLQSVKQEHCTYTLEVYEPGNTKALAEFPLNPYAIHHPHGLDLALIHLKQEENALAELRKLGVESMYLRENDDDFVDGEEFTFEGFEIVNDPSIDESEKNDKNDIIEDTRIFVPYSMPGKLFAASNQRFFARTESPLPEGVCGGPTIDKLGTVSGIVEGIIPKDHEDKNLAGAAAFVPSIYIRQFIIYAERIILEKILPSDLMSHVVELKRTGTLGNTNMTPNHCNDEFQKHVQLMRQYYSNDEVDKIVKTVKNQTAEAIKIMESDGGDLNEVIKDVFEKNKEKHADVYKIIEMREKERIERLIEQSQRTMEEEKIAQRKAWASAMNPNDQGETTEAEYVEKPEKDDVSSKSS